MHHGALVRILNNSQRMPGRRKETGCSGYERGEVLSGPMIMKCSYESHYTKLKLTRNRKCKSVQKSEDHKTRILMLLGEIIFVIGPDCIFVNL